MKKHHFETDLKNSSVKRKKLVCICGHGINFKNHWEKDTVVTIGEVPEMGSRYEPMVQRYDKN